MCLQTGEEGGIISGGHISGIEKNVSERRDKTYLRNEFEANMPLHLE